jgi:hypothetical protein
VILLSFLRHPVVIDVLEAISQTLLLTIMYVNVPFQGIIITILAFLRKRRSFKKDVWGGRPGIVV